MKFKVGDIAWNSYGEKHRVICIDMLSDRGSKRNHCVVALRTKRKPDGGFEETILRFTEDGVMSHEPGPYDLTLVNPFPPVGKVDFKLKWGVLRGKEHVYYSLVDLDSEHLENILVTHTLPVDHARTIIEILKQRYGSAKKG